MDDFRFGEKALDCEDLMVIFFCTLSAIFAVFAIHPFVSYPLSLKLIAQCRKTRRTEFSYDMSAKNPPIRFAVCMCAYNEEHIIEQKLANLLALREREPTLEILVYVDGATDRTASILYDYADKITVHVSAERRGKTHGMNLLASRATASVIVFTDANVMLAMDALSKLQAYFFDPEIGCVCGHLIYTNGIESITAASGSLYWRLEETIKKLEEATGSVMGADGSLFAIRRTLHHPPPDHLIDDMYVSFMILCEGHRVVQAADVNAYEASVSSAREEFHRKARIACQAFNVHRLLWPRIRQLDALTVYKYVSHKLMRWFTVYSLVFSLLFLLAALFIAGMALPAMALIGLVLTGLLLGYLWAIAPFSQMVDLLLALAGTGLGVWQSSRGRHYQTWTPAASIRKS
jgi:cellulose synthase/poly-beta-1,6-N-acetylglucosamine synthase-like glycosyltransferase